MHYFYSLLQCSISSEGVYKYLRQISPPHPPSFHTINLSVNSLPRSLDLAERKMCSLLNLERK